MSINFQPDKLLNERTRTTAPSKSFIDLVMTNSKECLSHSGVYPLSVSVHRLMYAVRKKGVPREQPRFIESKNRKHFDDTKFKLDLESAAWPSTQDVNEA